MPNISDHAATIADPIFAAATPRGTARVSFFEVMAAAQSGDLVGLPGMKAHQRPAVVTALAILIHTLSRYAARAPSTAEQWQAEWVAQLGGGTLRLVAPITEAAFLQPPTDGPGTPSSIAEVDALFQSQAHEAKPQMLATPEEWAYALMASTWRQYGGPTRYSGAREGLLVVLPSDGQSIASEIAHLVSAFASHRPLQVGAEAAPRSAADHMLWLRHVGPTSASIPLTQCPYPFIDARAVRLHQNGDGISAATYRMNGEQVDVPANIDDPHVPLQDGRPFKVIKARPFDHRVMHAALFGGAVQKKGSPIQRPPILDAGTPYRSVRLCALGTDPPGKTAGYWEAVFALTRAEGGFSFGGDDVNTRAADLSARALEAVANGQGVLYGALVRLFASGELTADKAGKRERRSALVQQFTERYQALAGPASVQTVLDALQADADVEAEQRALNTLATNSAVRVFEAASTALINPLDAAAARLRLSAGLRARLPGASMSTDQDLPHLARQTFAILREMVAHLTPSDRAGLRTMNLASPPVAFWAILAAAPPEQTNDDRCIDVWKRVLRALGHLRVGGPSAGEALAHTEFPRMRMDRLLAATGSSLPGLIDEALRWLISHDVTRADLSAIATLGLADARGDTDARAWARRTLALAYVRADSRAQAPTPTPNPQPAEAR